MLINNKFRLFVGTLSSIVMAYSFSGITTPDPRKNIVYIGYGFVINTNSIPVFHEPTEKSKKINTYSPASTFNITGRNIRDIDSKIQKIWIRVFDNSIEGFIDTEEINRNHLLIFYNTYSLTSPKKIFVNKDGAPLKDKPFENSPTVNVLIQGDRLIADSISRQKVKLGNTEGIWYYVSLDVHDPKYDPNKSSYGYIHSSFISETFSENSLDQNKKNISLIKSCMYGDSNLSEIRNLILSGADVNYKDPETGSTPLMIASHYCNENTMRLLIEKKANVNAQNLNGNTVLLELHDSANVYSMSDCVRAVIILLIKSGADPAIKNKQGESAISDAQDPERSEFIKELKKQKY